MLEQRRLRLEDLLADARNLATVLLHPEDCVPTVFRLADEEFFCHLDVRDHPLLGHARVRRAQQLEDRGHRRQLLVKLHVDVLPAPRCRLAQLAVEIPHGLDDEPRVDVAQMLTGVPYRPHVAVLVLAVERVHAPLQLEKRRSDPVQVLHRDRGVDQHVLQARVDRRHRDQRFQLDVVGVPMVLEVPAALVDHRLGHVPQLGVKLPMKRILEVVQV